MSISVSDARRASESVSPKSNRRAESKAKTRKKVLESARALFMTRGYEGATMRDIASEAGLSTGALFANFQDKADLFNAVLAEDFQAQQDKMRGAVSIDGGVQDKLLALMTTGYEFHLGQLPLLQAGISVSWSQGLSGELGERPAWRKVIALIVGVLEDGVQGGELRGDFDVQLMAEMLWDNYLSNFRRAMFGDSGLDELRTRFSEQSELLLRGVRKGSAH